MENPGFLIIVAKYIKVMIKGTITPKKTMVLLLGGGISKHHCLNAQIQRNGADFAVNRIFNIFRSLLILEYSLIAPILELIPMKLLVGVKLIMLQSLLKLVVKFLLFLLF